MFDLATAAVDAALAAGARYADARIMIVRYESMSAKNGVVEGLTQTETAGIGVRALIGSSWGFQATPELTAAAARRAGERAAEVARASARVAGAPDRPGAGAGGGGELGEPVRGAPARRREPLRAGRPAGGRHHHHRRRRDPARAGQPPDLGHREVVRLERGQPHRPAHRRVRRGDGRHRHRRRRDAAAQLPGRARPVRHPRAGRSCARSTCPGNAPRIADEAKALLVGAAVPGEDHHPHPRQRADGAPDPRVGRPRHRARPHPRVGGRLRRHVVARSRPSSGRCATAPT